jgi:glycosyltransferase involved in cell wall biosynthesis
MSLSVVVIGRNEEAHIAQCLRSVIDAANRAGGAEIVLVDSASTDGTVAIARSCGIRVISLNPTREMSASAGRFVGFHKTGGELIMFVDGDTVIDRDWFRLAIPYFEQPEIAGIMGYLNDFDAKGQILPYVGHRSSEVRTCHWLRGIGMYRRAAMDAAGTFNPYLVIEEEAELAMRLRKGGWRLLSVPDEMGNHLHGAAASDSVFSESHRRRFVWIGRTLRYSLSAGTGMRFIFERNLPTIAFVVAIVCFGSAATFSLMGHRLVAGVTVAGLALGLAAIGIKKASFLGPLLYVGQHCLILGGMLRVLTSQVKDPRDYPLDVIEPETP